MNFPPKSILVPTDLSEGAELALSYAFALGGAVSAKVHLLHAISVPIQPGDRSALHGFIDELQAQGRQALMEIATRYASTQTAGQQIVQPGDPRDLIVEWAGKVDAGLIVMGTHGRRGLSRMLLGSVAESVVRTAQCPVLVIPPKLDADR
jgi:universal stress protein A